MSDCDVLHFYELLGKKWTYGLFHNISATPQSFNDLEKSTKNEINPTLLSQRLKELVRLKLVSKQEVDGRLQYALTEPGQRLKDILFEIKSLADELGWHMPDECSDLDCEQCSSFKKKTETYLSL